MEDTLREGKRVEKIRWRAVLILVLMEDTLRAEMNYDKDSDWCLNPCFNGRYPQRVGNGSS